MLKVAVELQPQ